MIVSVVNFWVNVLVDNPDKKHNIERLLELLDTGYMILK